jgi:hypothetical protein
MAIAYKRKLSGSTSGSPLRMVGTAATSGSNGTIHAAVAGEVAGTFDEIWIWAANQGTLGTCNLTLQFGGTAAEYCITAPIPAGVGLVPVIPGLILQNSLLVRGYAATSNMIGVIGYVNTMTD